MDKVSKYLFDIQSSISLIESFLKDIDTFNDYQNDLKTQSAVERQLAIIGEVVNKLKQEDSSYTLTYAKQMIDFRNRLIHSYDNIDSSIVWVILRRHLPALKGEIENFINK
jgi:uncharacterized protein with HEPN domain